MVRLSSKVPGMDVWAYDYSRRPDKTLVNGKPKSDLYTAINKQYDSISPATHEPTEYLNQTVNSFRYVFDINHCSNGAIVDTHGIKFNTSDGIDGTLKPSEYHSVEKYNNAMFYGDDIYIAQHKDGSGKDITPSFTDDKTPFTVTTPGIKILYQTGIVQYNRGYGVMLFEVEPGYKIPVGTIITATPTQQNAFGNATITGTPETFSVTTDIVPGIYDITITADQYNDWKTCDVNFNTKQDTSTLPHSKITFDLSHCTVSPNDTTVVNGSHSWTFTADPGYIFDEPGGIVNPNTGKAGNEIPTTSTNVTHLNNYNVQGDTEIALTANKQQIATIPFVQNLTHVQSNVDSASIGRKLNAISLTADTGYTFQSSIQVLFYSGGKVASEYNVDGNNKNSITIPLNTTKDNTITDSMDNIKLTATATQVTLSAGYEHNYLVTDTELNSFSKDHIWNYTGDNQEDTYNVSQYINNLIELPFKVNTTTTVNQILVGRVQSNVVSHEVKSRFVTLDLGTIKAPYKYNNAYDYQTQTIKLFAPFVSPITIEPTNAINQPIHIVYKIDLSNGNLTVNLYNNTVLFFTGINNIASQLPFLNKLKNTIINRDTHFNDNDIRQPYMVITREEPILNNDYYPTIERGVIKNYNGNVKVRLLNNMNIPNNELSELTSQLESGVKYVKSN